MSLLRGTLAVLLVAAACVACAVFGPPVDYHLMIDNKSGREQLVFARGSTVKPYWGVFVAPPSGEGQWVATQIFDHDGAGHVVPGEIAILSPTCDVLASYSITSGDSLQLDFAPDGSHSLTQTSEVKPYAEPYSELATTDRCPFPSN